MSQSIKKFQNVAGEICRRIDRALWTAMVPVSGPVESYAHHREISSVGMSLLKAAPKTAGIVAWIANAVAADGHRAAAAGTAFLLTSFAVSGVGMARRRYGEWRDRTKRKEFYASALSPNATHPLAQQADTILDHVLQDMSHFQTDWGMAKNTYQAIWQSLVAFDRLVQRNPELAMQENADRLANIRDSYNGTGLEMYPSVDAYEKARHLPALSLKRLKSINPKLKIAPPINRKEWESKLERIDALVQRIQEHGDAEVRHDSIGELAGILAKHPRLMTDSRVGLLEASAMRDESAAVRGAAHGALERLAAAAPYKFGAGPDHADVPVLEVLRQNDPDVLLAIAHEHGDDNMRYLTLSRFADLVEQNNALATQLRAEKIGALVRDGEKDAHVVGEISRLVSIFTDIDPSLIFRPALDPVPSHVRLIEGAPIPNRPEASLPDGGTQVLPRRLNA
ncbi:MAG: hypothetical protein WDO70_00195 [Alphaproteobacteria bacterium]